MNNFEAIMIAEGAHGANEKKWVEAWQHLIDTGLCWTLQGWFGRQAQRLIDGKVCHSPGVEDEQRLDQ